MSETQRPDAPEGVYFVWQKGPARPMRAVVFGPKPPERKNGDGPFVLAVHELTGDLLAQVTAAHEKRDGAEQPHGAFPWAQLEAAFPAPVGG